VINATGAASILRYLHGVLAGRRAEHAVHVGVHEVLYGRAEVDLQKKIYLKNPK
jgi:hypothetical protein